MPRQDQPSRSGRGRAGSTGRQARPGYTRFLRRSVVGTLVPGVGLITGGWRRTGGIVLAGFVLGLAAVAVYAVRAGRVGLVRLGADSDRINVIGFGLVAVAAVWLLIALVSFYLLEPRGLTAGRRLLAALLVTVVASVVITPMGIGSRYAFTQRDFIESVFPDEYEQHSLTIPEDSTDEDPWAGEDRVNVLILGSDAGPGREGTRTDTIMVASIDTESGDTGLFALPRNLLNVPFPEGPIREAYPSGYRGVPESRYWLSAIYRYVPHEFPEYFDGIENPGAEAVKLAVGEVLGLDIGYYVMVNLDGFQALVDALGGVVIDVPYRIPMGTQATTWGTCTEPRAWIEAGEQRLDGGEALWFARARCGPPPISDDYERMRRQRCLIGAVAEQAKPFTLLTRYLQLEEAVRANISTDIGRQRLKDFAELALRVQEGEMRSLPFTDAIIPYGAPDYDLIRQFVQDSLAAPGPEESSAGDDADANGTESDEVDGDGHETDDTDQTQVDGHEDGAGLDQSEEPDESENLDQSEEPDESEGAQLIDDVC